MIVAPCEIQREEQSFNEDFIEMPGDTAVFESGSQAPFHFQVGSHTADIPCPGPLPVRTVSRSNSDIQVFRMRSCRSSAITLIII